VAGEPTKSQAGYAAEIRAYNRRGLRVSSSYRNVQGKQIRREAWRYDSAGRIVEQAVFGPDDQPVAAMNGCHRLVNTYDARGNRIRADWYGPDGRRARNAQDFAIVLSSYDARGREIEARLLGPDEEVIVSGWSGSSIIRYEYDPRDRVTAVRHFGPQDTPVVGAKGYHARLMAYDRWGNEIRRRFLGADGQARVNPQLGCASLRRKVDARGRIVELRFFDAEGELTEDRRGVAVETYRYDRFWRRVEVLYFDVEGNPVRPVDPETGG
jgi:hypothetical protein